MSLSFRGTKSFFLVKSSFCFAKKEACDVVRGYVDLRGRSNFRQRRTDRVLFAKRDAPVSRRIIHGNIFSPSISCSCDTRFGYGFRATPSTMFRDILFEPTNSTELNVNFHEIETHTGSRKYLRTLTIENCYGYIIYVLENFSKFYQHCNEARVSWL